MAFDLSLTETLCLLGIFCDTHVNAHSRQDASDASSQVTPSATIRSHTSIRDQSALITDPPELRLRSAFPNPQDGDTCQQAEQSASQAIQQASQQASQSIQQASQQLTQSVAQASRSASQGILQAQQSASQSIAAADRSVSSVISSASSAIASVQASAASAISQASGQMQSAQISASAAQSDANRAVLQAGAAVAAATGSAAAAGSSFLAAAAKATQGAQASVSAFGAAASSQLAQASQQVSASQTQAITATQVAIAIVGSIIASVLMTMLIYFLIIRHKKKAKRRSYGQRSPGSGFSSDQKFPVSDQVDSTIAASQSNYLPAPGLSSSSTSLMFSKTFSGEDPSFQKTSDIKASNVPWNPRNPPKPPSLGSWLKLQDGVSPFGPINLSNVINAKSPLGGQLKSPLRTIDNAPPTPFTAELALRSPTIPVMIESKPVVSVVNILPRRPPTIRKPVSQQTNYESPSRDPMYRQSKASVWTDDVPDTRPSPALPSPPRVPREPASVTRGYTMQIPSPKNPRSTAEWLAERATIRDSSNTVASGRPSLGLGLPSNPSASRATFARSRLSGQPQGGGGGGFGEGLDRVNSLLRFENVRSQTTTPQVGKAL